MADFESMAMENVSGLARIIGVDNLADVQRRIGDLIVDRVESDLNNYDM